MVSDYRPWCFLCHCTKTEKLLYPHFEEEGGYTCLALSILLSVTNIFCSTFLSKPCITATLDLVWSFGSGPYTSLSEFRSARYLLPVLRLTLFCDVPSVTNIFGHTFLQQPCITATSNLIWCFS